MEDNILKWSEGILIELSGVKRLLRRKYLIHKRKKYVDNQIKLRKGVCGKHGCCDLAILSRITNKHCLSVSDRTVCLLWPKINFECRVYPIDEKDKIPETVSYCNFHWDK